MSLLATTAVWHHPTRPLHDPTTASRPQRLPLRAASVLSSAATGTLQGPMPRNRLAGVKPKEVIFDSNSTESLIMLRPRSLKITIRPSWHSSARSTTSTSSLASLVTAASAKTRPTRRAQEAGRISSRSARMNSLHLFKKRIKRKIARHSRSPYKSLLRKFWKLPINLISQWPPAVATLMATLMTTTAQSINWATSQEAASRAMRMKSSQWQELSTLWELLPPQILQMPLPTPWRSESNWRQSLSVPQLSRECTRRADRRSFLISETTSVRSMRLSPISSAPSRQRCRGNRFSIQSWTTNSSEIEMYAFSVRN